jgi:hypothetical protein
MVTINLYSDAHLFVAAVRVIQHRRKTPPEIEEVCELLGLSKERGLYLLRRLVQEAIVETVAQHDSNRIFIKDHLKIELLQQAQEASNLDKALEAFQAKRGQMDKKVGAIRASQQKKQQDLFADLESKLKGGLKSKSQK